MSAADGDAPPKDDLAAEAAGASDDVAPDTPPPALPPPSDTAAAPGAAESAATADAPAAVAPTDAPAPADVEAKAAAELAAGPSGADAEAAADASAAAAAPSAEGGADAPTEVPADSSEDVPSAEGIAAAAAPADGLEDMPPAEGVAAAAAPAGLEGVPTAEGVAETVRPADGLEDKPPAEGVAAVIEPADGPEATLAEVSVSPGERQAGATGEVADTANGPAEAAEPVPADSPENEVQVRRSGLEEEQEPASSPYGSVERVEVQDKHVDVDGSAGGTSAAALGAQLQQEDAARAEETAERVRAALAGAIAEIDGNFAHHDQARQALVDWKLRLENHVQELKQIVEQQSAPPAGTTASTDATSLSAVAGAQEKPEQELHRFHYDDLQRMTLMCIRIQCGWRRKRARRILEAKRKESADPEEMTAEILGSVPDVRTMRQQLECHRTGRDVAELATWVEPEEMEREVADLRRVRHQIRYLFGGMIEKIPESTTLRVDDLLGNLDVPLDHTNRQEAIGNTVAPPKMEVDAVGNAPVAKFVPQAPPGKPPTSGRTNSSTSTVDSQDSRRRERKERKHRHRSRGEHGNDEATSKRDDGGLPTKQRNWAEEVVKASLDPSNQWEFPKLEGPTAGAGSSRSPNHGLPSWEHPRQARASDVATKARERAEEVLRSERGQQRHML